MVENELMDEGVTEGVNDGLEIEGVCCGGGSCRGVIFMLGGLSKLWTIVVANSDCGTKNWFNFLWKGLRRGNIQKMFKI